MAVGDARAVLDGVEPTIRPIVLPGPRVRDKLAAGVPLLHGEEVYLDGGAVRATWDGLLDALGETGQEATEVAAVRAALAGHRLHAEHATVEALVNHPEHVAEIALLADVPTGIVQRLADLAARPVLAAYARQLAPALRLAPWSRTFCPICGAVGEHADRATGDGASRLRCGRCATAWDVQRVAGDAIADAGAAFRLELADSETEWDGFDDD